MPRNDPSWANKPRHRVAAGMMLLPLIAFSAWRIGGREHFFQALPAVLWSFGKLIAFLACITFFQWALIKTALRRGWTTEQRLRRNHEADAYARRRLWKAALVLFFWGFGGSLLLIWWFLNRVPGKPGLAKLDMARIESAYWFMGLTEVIALAVVLTVGLRWVQTRTGKAIHSGISIISPAFFAAVCLFHGKEPNAILALWIMTVTLLPTVYLFLLYQSFLRRTFLKNGPGA